MTSTLRVDNIQLKDGTPVLENGIIAVPSAPGTILEVLTSACDGSTVTVKSGTYTFQNVTAIQKLTTSPTVATGSQMTYVPPPGTTRVKYDYNFQIAADDGTDGLGYFQFWIDGAEVEKGHFAMSPYRSMRATYSWIIDCNAETNDPLLGKFTEWTTPKVLYVTGDEYGSSYQVDLHNILYRDAAGADELSVPTLTITAIA